MKKTRLLCSALILAALVPAACSITENREITAERIARPAFMVERRLDAGPADFQLWERMHQRFAPANVYIEGDGVTSADGSYFSNTTPDNPVGLHLASRDNAENLLYVGRPCQFRDPQDKKECAPALWSNRRFSPEVVAAYNQVLDEVKRRYDISEFNLIGYDGGANIAAALATQREDVKSVRTVAGTLNPAISYDPKKDPIDADSITAFGLAPQLATVPQHHFIGAGDTVGSAETYHSFRQQMGESKCVHYTFVQDADHTRGWVEKWPELLKATVECEPEHIPVELPPRPVSKDGPNK
jgi:dienelactone hydrolase